MTGEGERCTYLINSVSAIKETTCSRNTSSAPKTQSIKIFRSEEPFLSDPGRPGPIYVSGSLSLTETPF